MDINGNKPRKFRFSNKAPSCLFEYYKTLNMIERRRLAKYLKMTVVQLSQLVHGHVNLYLDTAFMIVIFSQGSLTVEQLRPDMSPYLETITSRGDGKKCRQIKIRLKKLE